MLDEWAWSVDGKQDRDGSEAKGGSGGVVEGNGKGDEVKGEDVTRGGIKGRSGSSGSGGGGSGSGGAGAGAGAGTGTGFKSESGGGSGGAGAGTGTGLKSGSGASGRVKGGDGVRTLSEWAEWKEGCDTITCFDKKGRANYVLRSALKKSRVGDYSLELRPLFQIENALGSIFRFQV